MRGAAVRARIVLSIGAFLFRRLVCRPTAYLAVSPACAAQDVRLDALRARYRANVVAHAALILIVRLGFGSAFLIILVRIDRVVFAVNSGVMRETLFVGRPLRLFLHLIVLVLLRVNLTRRYFNDTFNNASRVNDVPEFEGVVRDGRRIFLRLVPCFLLKDIFQGVVNVFEFRERHSFIPRRVCLGVPRYAWREDLYRCLILYDLIRFGVERVARRLITARGACMRVFPVCVITFMGVVVIMGGAYPIARFGPEEEAPSLIQNRVMTGERPARPDAFLVGGAMTNVCADYDVFQLVPVDVINRFVKVVGVRWAEATSDTRYRNAYRRWSVVCLFRGLRASLWIGESGPVRASPGKC